MQCERKESNGFGANVPTAVVLDVALKQMVPCFLSVFFGLVFK